MRARDLLAWLLARGRRQPGTGPATSAAERAIREADEEAVRAALQARTLRRGRIRVEEDSGEVVRRTAPPRGSR